MVYVLRTGCQWKALPKERFGSASAIHKRFLEWERVNLNGVPNERTASAIHKRFLEWERAGVFEAIWATGLAEYDQMEGIAWRWQSIEGAMVKAPLAQEQVGPNPTDRGKKWEQASSAGPRPWRPLVVHRDRSESA